MVTLTANLQSILTTSESGYLRITLCGFGAAIPTIPGTGVIANAGIPQIVGPGPSISQELYGNDVIQPTGTFYEVAILDTDENVIQANNYTLTGSGTVDISNLRWDGPPPPPPPYVRDSSDIISPASSSPITLSANLQSILGTSCPGYLRITLCGFGAAIPIVPAICVIANAGVPQLVGPGPNIAQLLYGNDIIQPSGTFYEIAILDDKKNVIQANNYTLTGSSSLDLSTIPPIEAPFGFPLENLNYVPCEATADPTVWNPVGTPIAVTYNGVILAYNDSTRLSWSMVNNQIKLNFTPDSSDLISSFSIVSYYGAPPGSAPGNTAPPFPPAGVAVSTGAAWGTSINPATLAPYPAAGVPVSTGSAWGTSIPQASLATYPAAGVPVSTGTAWGTPINPANLLTSAATQLPSGTDLNTIATPGLYWAPSPVHCPAAVAGNNLLMRVDGLGNGVVCVQTLWCMTCWGVEPDTYVRVQRSANSFGTWYVYSMTQSP